MSNAPSKPVSFSRPKVGYFSNRPRISRNWRKALLDVRNKKGADIGSDHHKIMGILRIRTQKVIKRTINTRRYNIKRLEDIECQKTFKTKLRERASALRYETREGVEEKWEKNKDHLPTH